MQHACGVVSVYTGDRNKFVKVMKKNKQYSYSQVHMLIQLILKLNSICNKRIKAYKINNN